MATLLRSFWSPANLVLNPLALIVVGFAGAWAWDAAWHVAGSPAPGVCWALDLLALAAPFLAVWLLATGAFGVLVSPAHRAGYVAVLVIGGLLALASGDAVAALGPACTV